MRFTVTAPPLVIVAGETLPCQLPSPPMAIFCACAAKLKSNKVKIIPRCEKNVCLEGFVCIIIMNLKYVKRLQHNNNCMSYRQSKAQIYYVIIAKTLYLPKIYWFYTFFNRTLKVNIVIQ